METRKEFIIDITEHYKKNHKEEYKSFIKQVKSRKEKLADRRLARTRDKGGQAQISLPERLHSILDYALDNPRFLDDVKELRWFAKKYPEFQIPYEL